MKLKGGLNVLDKVIVIAGPTASGKSSYAVELAKKIDGEIISADSMQIFQGLDIGTAKINYSQQSGIVHHMIDVVAADQSFSVAAFQVQARQAIQDIIAKKKCPIIVGGSGLYIQALLFDYQFIEQEPIDYSRYDHLTAQQLWERLALLDGVSAVAINWQNRRRVTHALAMAEQTSYTKTEREQQQQQKLCYDILAVALMPERTMLYERINTRVDSMMRQGLMAEVEYFSHKFALCDQIRAAIGYKEPLAYLDGQIDTLDEVTALIQKNTRHFAKRQCTWLRNQRIDYRYIDENTSIIEDVSRFVAY